MLDMMMEPNGAVRPGRNGDDPVMTGLRVILADDDVLLRAGLSSLLERSGFQVVGQAGDGRHLLELVRDTGPDLVIVDIRMPPSHTGEGLNPPGTAGYRHPGAVRPCRGGACDGAAGQRSRDRVSA